MPRPSTRILSPEIIARAALDMVRREHDFTIPGVAARLGVNPSSLYHHAPGGRAEIIALVRRELYAGIDCAALRDSARPWRGRLAAWIREYRAASAMAPASVPLLVGSAVDDEATLEIYEALMSILADAGVPRADWIPLSAMLDAIVMGSAVDAGAPVPLWRVPEGPDAAARFPLLREALPGGDGPERPLQGLDLAVAAAVVQVERHAQATGDRCRRHDH
ncbi:TetR/AcrR family transcriptional regulator [Sediminivirga luteola]|uniref:Tetracycline repressor, C-all-alpha domain protein n=1 Tax=Sediminivirga luteola TaxID=1774748 RepID=A0A8J2XJD7_9MICO|nr:TetR/AcrR family transcriptional regulator [Sediminivirga luteola]GGA19638.1 tetracycline repressor, C-all-alpha domain protein [Sediminivirga luteola]